MENSEQNSLSLEQEAIQNCENEPIHNIGYIQPFGFLFAVNPTDFIVMNVSENLADWFDCPITKILGAHVSEFLDKEIIHQFNNALSHSTITTQREYVGRLEKKNSICEVFVHLKQKRLIVELQPLHDEPLKIKLLDRVQQVLQRLRRKTDVQSFMEQAVQELRFISGFNRVKTYKFLSDGSGEVIAESRESCVDSFLGLRFPAFDIPDTARKLYTTTPIRILPSIDAEQVPILSHKSSPEKLDLSLAILRGIVPVHSMYLKNMGVKATLTLPIVLNGKMWGLFAFHHEEELMLSSEILSSLEILGNTIAMTLGTILQKQLLTSMKECTRLASILFLPDESPLGFSTYWESAKNELATLISCQGVSLVSKEKIHTYGTCPHNDSIRLLAENLQNHLTIKENDSKPIAIESIPTKYPNLDCGEIAGVLAIPNPAAPFDFLFYFRLATDKAVRWAGNPKKDIEKVYGGVRLNPRASFTEYINSNQKRSDKFSEEEMVIGESLKDALDKITSISVIQSQHRSRLGLVIRELNHRVRNTLTLIGSIVAQTKNSSHTLEEYIKSLETRIQSLSATQKLLTEFDWEEVDIKTLFKHSLIPYKELLENRIMLRGPKVNLKPAMGSLLALVINELSLNAVKYGALHNSEGIVDLSWKTTSDKLVISWIEAGGPPVQSPTRQGFGTSLIKEALVYEFSADCTLNFLKKGIEAKFIIPFVSNKSKVETSTPDKNLTSNKNKAFSALVLEDDYVISKSLVETLKELGASNVDAAPNLKVVKNLIKLNEYDIAFLDVNIHGEFSSGISKLLDEKNIPFAFVTGYGSRDQELNDLNSLAVLSKPVTKKELTHILNLANLR